MSIEQSLDDEERLAQLDLDQLKHWVGLVEYDESADPFPMSGWDVGDAVPTKHFFRSAFGVRHGTHRLLRAGDGQGDHHAFVLRSGAARLVVTGAYDPASPLVDQHRVHGDGIVDIALTVPDVDR